MALIPVAALLTPHFWLAGLLMIVVSRYATALEHVTAGPSDPEAASRKALRRLRQAYRLREWLARRRLRNAVHLAYMLKHWQMKTTIAGHGLNPYRAASEEITQERLRRQKELLSHLCEFVYVAGLGKPAAGRRDDVFFEFSTLLPDGPGEAVMSDVLVSTFTDGPGFLSTLTALTYVHYIHGLPPVTTEEIQKALARLELDTEVFGWLSNRVVEATIYLHVEQGRSGDEIVATLQPALVEITSQIRAAADDEGLFAVKWDGRRRLHELGGVRQ